MEETDVTNLVSFGENDGGLLPLTKCVCGEEYNSWDFVINDDKERLQKCDKCGREFYFSNDIKVLMVEE